MLTSAVVWIFAFYKYLHLRVAWDNFLLFHGFQLITSQLKTVTSDLNKIYGTLTCWKKYIYSYFNNGNLKTLSNIAKATNKM